MLKLKFIFFITFFLSSIGLTQTGHMFWETKHFNNAAFGGMEFSKNAMLNGSSQNLLDPPKYYFGYYNGAYNTDEAFTNGNIGLRLSYSLEQFGLKFRTSSMSVNYSRDLLKNSESQLRVGGVFGFSVYHKIEVRDSKDSLLNVFPRSNGLSESIGVAFDNSKIVTGLSIGLTQHIQGGFFSWTSSAYFALQPITIFNNWSFIPRLAINLDGNDFDLNFSSGFRVGKIEFGTGFNFIDSGLNYDTSIPFYFQYNLTQNLKLGYSFQRSTVRFFSDRFIDQQLQLSWRIKK